MNANKQTPEKYKSKSNMSKSVMGDALPANQQHKLDVQSNTIQNK